MMIAQLFDGRGQPFRRVTLPRPTLAPGEVLVRISLATVCGSDLHTLAGHRHEPTPCVLGHEAVGIVEEVCGDVHTLDGRVVEVGMRIVWTVAAACGTCFFCNVNLPQKCEHLRKYGHTRHDETRGPSGAFATHLQLWPGTGIVEVPSSVPDAVAAPAACATATVAACLKAANFGELASPTVLILGAGMLGLSAAAMAHAAGARVMLADNSVARLELARSFGATATLTLPATLDDARAAVDRFTHNRGADVVLEFTGAPMVTTLGLGLARIGGTLILAGAVFPTEPIPLVPETLIRRLLTLRGVHNYTPADLQTAVAFLAKHANDYPFETMVGGSFTLDEIASAIQFATQYRPLRVGLQP